MGRADTPIARGRQTRGRGSSKDGKESAGSLNKRNHHTGPSIAELDARTARLQRQKQLLAAKLQEKDQDEAAARKRKRSIDDYGCSSVHATDDDPSVDRAGTDAIFDDGNKRRMKASRLRAGFANIATEDERARAAEEAARKHDERREQKRVNAHAGAPAQSGAERSAQLTDSSMLARLQNASESDHAQRILRASSDEAVLGLTGAWTNHELKRAYHIIAWKLHPDRASVQQATQAFQLAQHAYQRLNKRISIS